METRERSVSGDSKRAIPLIKSRPKPNAALASKALAVHLREAKHVVFRRPRGRLELAAGAPALGAMEPGQPQVGTDLEIVAVATFTWWTRRSQIRVRHAP